MRILDLFSGLGGWAKPFRERDHEVVTVDIDPRFGCDITANVLTLTAERLGRFDLVLASVPCECFSVASIGTYWQSSGVPKHPRAEAALGLLLHTLKLIEDIAPRWFIIENPRGMMRKIPAMQALERRTVTFCQYGEKRMKPTDLWGRFPKGLMFHPACKNGAACHERAPRGARTGTQGIQGSALRAVIPYALALQVCIAAEAAGLTEEE